MQWCTIGPGRFWESCSACGPASPFAAEPAKELECCLREDRLRAGNIKVFGGVALGARQLGGGGRWVKH